MTAPTLPDHRPVKIVGREREPRCGHGLIAGRCLLNCICPGCGQNRAQITAKAARGGRLMPAELRCWSGMCGR